MEQKTTSKLTIGSFFIILLIVLYFGNIGSIKVNDKLEQTNQKLDQLIGEVQMLQTKVDDLESASLVSQRDSNHKLEGLSQQTHIFSEKKDLDVNHIAETQTEEYAEITDSLVDISLAEDERAECCEGDEWAEIQQVRIRDVINTEIAVDTDLTINSIDCEDVVCEISLTIHNNSGMKDIAKTMSKLSPKDDDENKVNLRSIQVTNSGVEAKIQLIKKKKGNKE